jgi:hypothetical protein
MMYPRIKFPSSCNFDLLKQSRPITLVEIGAGPQLGENTNKILDALLTIDAPKPLVFNFPDPAGIR